MHRKHLFLQNFTRIILTISDQSRVETIRVSIDFSSADRYNPEIEVYYACGSHYSLCKSSLAPSELQNTSLSRLD